MVKNLLLVLVLMVAGLPMAVAQEEEAELQDFEVGALSGQIPDGWETRLDTGTLVIGNSEDALDRQAEGETPDEDDIVVIFTFSPVDYLDDMGVTAATLDGIAAEVFALLEMEDAQADEPELIRTDDDELGRLLVHREDYSQALYTFYLNDAILGAALAGDVTEITVEEEDLIQQTLLSFDYDGDYNDLVILLTTAD